MNPAPVSFARCLRHPSQFSSGFCSACLVERLSDVYTAERGPRRRKDDDDIIFASPSDFERKDHKVRERRTLEFLFRLEDKCSLDLQREASAWRNQSTAEEAAAGNENIHAVAGETETSRAAKHSPASSEHSKKSGSSFLRISSFPIKLPWRKKKTSATEISVPEKNQTVGAQGPELSRGKRSFRRSWEGTVPADAGKSASRGNSRKSWDGLVIGRALNCSFSRSKEAEMDGGAQDPWGQETSQRRSSTDLSEDVAASTSQEKSASPLRKSGKEAGVLESSRRRSHRWSKVWSWSITSPFRDIGHSRQPSLERSLSEPGHERRRTKAAEASVPGTAPPVNGQGIGRIRQTLYRSRNSESLSRKKERERERERERHLHRSRSAHFSSPRNVSNGLLRFYLTPLRSSRRSASRSRTTTSYSFGPGLFGIH